LETLLLGTFKFMQNKRFIIINNSKLLFVVSIIVVIIPICTEVNG